MPRSVPPRPTSTRGVLGAALALLGLICLFVAAVISYALADRWLQHTLLVRQTADDWLLALVNAETGTRGYIITGQEGFLDPYAAALRRERKLAGEIRRLASDNANQLQNVAAADVQAQRVMERLRGLGELVRAGQREQAVAEVSTAVGKQMMDACRAAVQRIREEEEQTLQRRERSASRMATFVVAGALLLIAAAIALLVFAWRRERLHDELLKRLATEARQRLAWTFEVASALSEARTREQVTEVVIAQGMRAATADTCTLYILDDNGKQLELLGERGVDPAIIDTMRRISDTQGHLEVFARMRKNESLWAEREAEYLALFPGIATLKASGPRAKAFWSVPLYVEGRAIGLLGMGFYAERKFSSDDRAFVEAFAQQCAQALLRAARMEREQEANRWFTTTLRSIGDAVIATDAAGQIVFMNPVAEALTHWTEADARGQPLQEVFCIVSEQTRLPVESPVSKVMRAGNVVGLANHTLLRSKLGVEIPINDSGSPIKNESGQLLGVVLVFRDASQEKRQSVRRDFLVTAGEVLVSSLDYPTTLSTVAQLAVPALADWCTIDIIDRGTAARQVAVAHIDPAKVQFAREFAERYPPDPNAPNGAPNVMRTGKSELYREITPELLEAGARDAEHLRLIRKLQLESAIVVPLRARGRTLGAMSFIYAESARRYSEDDLAFAEDFARRAAMALDNALVLREMDEARAQEQWMRNEAQVASRAKDEFLATVSHELRTPLNAILGWAVILRERENTPELDRGLAVIERNARAQAKLIEDVLDVSRIISGKLALNVVPTNVAEALTAAVETVTPAAEAKHITIFTETARAPDITVSADPNRLQQIIWNLLSNAVKFTPKGGKVWASTELQGSHVCIKVSDSGEGIRPDGLAAIFEPFHQADASTTRRHGGLGLGLAIVKQLVTAHGGTVHATSDGPGKGATFFVQLPARAHVAPVIGGPRLGTPRESTRPAANGGGPRLDGLQLLVIDDEQDVLMMVSEVLRERGATVHLASSAQQAMDKLSEITPDAIVSDIGMPGEDGYSLIRKIRALPPERGGGTPALALTAYARGEDALRAFAAGYQMHVAKPVEPAHLALAVATLCGRAQPES